jgi:hypothetical protein
MGRTVDDVAALLSVMADPTRHPAGSLGGDVRGTRVAWVGDLGGYLAVEPGVLELGRGAATVLAELGCIVEELVPAFDFPELWRSFLVWRGWNALELAPLHVDPALRAQLKPEIVWEIERGLELSALDVSRAVAVRQRWIDAVAALFQRYDAVLAPSTQVFPFAVTTPWPKMIAGREMDTYHRWMETVMPWSMAGTPVLGMPAGFDPRGLPAGVQLVGPAGADLAVLRLGRAYERATGWVAHHRRSADDGGSLGLVVGAGQDREAHDRRRQSHEADRAARDAQPEVLAEQHDADEGGGDRVDDRAGGQGRAEASVAVGGLDHQHARDREHGAGDHREQDGAFARDDQSGHGRGEAEARGRPDGPHDGRGFARQRHAHQNAEEQERQAAADRDDQRHRRNGGRRHVARRERQHGQQPEDDGPCRGPFRAQHLAPAEPGTQR